MRWFHGVPGIYLNADTGIGGGTGTSDTENDSSAAAVTAETSGSAVPPTEKKPDEKPKDAAPAAKYTEDDFTKLKSDFENHLRTATEKAAEDALKKASMKPEEKAEYEQKQRFEELDKREKEAAAKELRLDTLGILSEKQLDKDFLDYVIGTDKDSTVKRIDAFKGLFDKAVQAQVETRLAGKTPPAGSGAGREVNSIRDQFKSALGGF